jgi:Tfp pilus assembly protein PilO
MSRRRFVLLALPPLAVVLAAWLLLWSPRSQELADQQARVAELQNQQALLGRRVDRARAFAAEDRAAELDVARAALPPDPDLGGFVTEHQDMARDAGVEVMSVAPIPLDDDDTSELGEVEVSMTVLGERARVVDYTRQLTELSRLTEVEDVTLTTEGDGRTSADVRVTVYHLPT